MADKIFINYRRDDRAAHATLIRDRLTPVYGATTIFMDVANLLPGEHFAERLEMELAGCDVLIAVIGPRWLELLNARLVTGERDYVREEIATALTRRIIVIPVLVDRAELPAASDLPEDIRSLVLYQKHVLTHERVDRDAAELVAAIDAVRQKMRPAPEPIVVQPSSAQVRPAWLARARIAAIALMIAGVAGIGALQQGLLNKPVKPPVVASIPHPATVPVSQAETQAIGAARASKAIEGFEAYLNLIRIGSIKGVFREEARRAIADLERWERTDKSSTDALKVYLKSAEQPLMSTEANTALKEINEKTERDACEAYAVAALAQVEQAKALACSVTGDRWSARKIVQLDQCVELKTVEARTAETGLRTGALAQCQHDKDEKQAWGKLEGALAAPPLPKAAPASKRKDAAPATTIPPEVTALRDQVTVITSEIAMIETFIAANPNGVEGKYSVKARAAIETRARQLDSVKVRLLEFDRAKWAEAETSPMRADGYNAYLAVLPDGEHTKAEIDAIIADIGTCDAIRKTDDVVAMRAYREEFPKGRCVEEFAKLIAPPKDLTGAKLVVRETQLPSSADSKASGAEKVGKVQARIIGLRFTDDSTKLHIISNYSDKNLVDLNLASGAIEPAKLLEDRWLKHADAERPTDIKVELPGSINTVMRTLRRGTVTGLYDPISARWKAIFTDAPETGTNTGNAASSFAWFEDGVIKVQEADGKTLLRSFPIKEKDPTIPRIAMSPDGRSVAALIKWQEDRQTQDGGDCNGNYDPPTKANRFTGGSDRSFGICTTTRKEVRIFNVLSGNEKKIGSKAFERRVLKGFADPDAAIEASRKGEAYKIVAAFSDPVVVDFSISGSLLYVGYDNGDIGIEYLSAFKFDDNRPKMIGWHRIDRIFELPRQSRLLLETQAMVDKRGAPPSPKGIRFTVVPLAPKNDTEATGRNLETPRERWPVGDVRAGARAISPDEKYLAAAIAGDANEPAWIHLWDIRSGRYLAWLKLLPDGGYVTGTPSGSYTMSDNAEPHLAVEIGKRRWLLSDLPAYKAKYYSKDGIKLLEPAL